MAFIASGYLVRLSKSFELKTSNSGVSYGQFFVSHTEYDTKTKSNKWVNMTCIAFGKTIETIHKNIKEKDWFIMQGEFKNSPFQKNDKGYDIPNWQYVVNNITFLPKSQAVTNTTTVADTDFSPVAVGDESDLPF